MASPASKASQLIDGLSWAIAENSRAGSKFQGLLDPSKVAVMGQSCGGLQTIEVSHDPRVTTSVLWNSGVFPTPTPLSASTKDSLAKLHAPIAYFDGGPSDVAYPNGEDDFTRLTVPVFKASLNVGHGGTFGHPGGGWYGVVGVAWLNWRLKGDEAAGRLFAGADYSLGKDTLWETKRRNMT